MLEKIIEAKIRTVLNCTHFEIVNESTMHNTSSDISHFKLIVVSRDFSGKMPVKRHQLVYKVLAEELAGPIHALALHTFDPEEWQQNTRVASSPNCLGKHNAAGKLPIKP